MDEAQFWKIVKQSRPKPVDELDEQLEALHTILYKLESAELISFSKHLRGRLGASKTWDMWGAAYLINGGCSDDGFDYFRGWLVSRGEEVFQAAMKDPDTLASIIEPEADGHEFEELWYVADEVHEEKFGERMPSKDGDDAANATTKGAEWDFEDNDVMKTRFPRLSAACTDQ